MQRTYLALATLAALAVGSGSLLQRSALALPSLPPPLPRALEQALDQDPASQGPRIVALEVIPYDAAQVPVEAPASQAYPDRVSSR